MKKSIILLAYLLLSTLIFAQSPPEKINYQAVARDLSGNPLINQTLSVEFEIRQGSGSGSVVYAESHTGISTNQFGLFTAEIGNGFPSAGPFSAINWGANLHYLVVIVNGISMGNSQLLSVPYALYAKESQNGPQGLPGRNSLSIVTAEPIGSLNCSNGGNKIEVGTDDNGNSTLDPFEIDFTYYVCNGDSGSAAGDDWGSQAVQTQGGNISGDGTPSNPLVVIDNDTSAINELQNLTISGNNINISNGTGISLSSTAPANNQVLTWNGTAWIAQNAGSGADNWGSQVVVSNATLNGDGTTSNPLSVNGVLTDSQDLTLTGNTLSLTNDLTPVDLTPYLDNTDAQTLSINANTLSITNGNSINLPSSPTYTAGTGIDLTSNIITNTAPDQTVVLTNGTGINVTGTYPNFTVANTSPASSTSITGGGLTTVTGTSPSFTVTTPAQTLSFTSPNLTLSNGGGTISLPTGTVTGVTGSGNIASSGGTTPNITFTGILPIANGGTNNGTLGSAGRIIYSNGTQYASSVVGTAGQVLTSAGTGAPVWTNPSVNTDNQNLSSTFSPSTVTVNITGGTGTTFSIDDADPNPANELITSFGVNGTNLEIIEAGNTWNVPLTSLAAAGKWTEGGGALYPTILTNNVVIGANAILNTKFKVFNNNELTSVDVINSTSSGTQTTGLTLANNGGGNGNKVGINANTSGTGGVANTGVLSNVSNGTTNNTAFDGQAYPGVSTVETTVFKGRIIGGTGNAQTYGINVVNQSSSLGDAFGGFFAVSNNNAQNIYGVRADISSSAADQYGLYSLNTAAGGTNKYGIYSYITGGTNNWAGYFAGGNVFIQDSLGIGTGSPSAKLHLEGSLRLNNLSGTAPAVGSVLTSIDALGNAEWAPPATTTTYWSPNGADIYNNNAGNVGIGTAAPAHRLHVAGNSLLDGVTQIGGTSGLSSTLKVFSGFGAATAYFFNSSNQPSLSVWSSGNITIGTATTEVTKLFIQDNNTNTGAIGNSYISMQNLANAPNTSTGIRFRVGGTTGINGNFHYKGGIFFSHAGTSGQGNMIFAVNNVASSANVTTADEVMRITQVGNVGIGVTAPTSKLEVTTNVSNNYVTRITNSNTTNGGTHGMLVSLGVTNPSSSNSYIAMSWGGSIRGTISGNGSTGVMYNTSSDKRLKENISEFNALSLIEKIEPKLYNFIGYDKKEHGFLAQDLQLVYPEAVKGDPNSDPIKDPMMVDYSKLTPLLTGGIKELHQLIKEQQQMIEELKKEVELLKNK